MKAAAPKTSSKEKVLRAALSVIRAKGYHATTVEDLCAAAGVTKGAFFHHFTSKEDLAVSAADYWASTTDRIFAHAPYQKLQDPLARVLGYIDFRKALIQGELPEFTCLVGTMVQESFGTNPKIREACRKSIFGHAAEIAKDIKKAKSLYAPSAGWAPESLALYTQATIQGAFILAKANNDSEIAVQILDHLRRYFELLFPKSKKPRRKDDS